MEFQPFSSQLTDPNPQNESDSRPVSQMGTDCFEFEFPTAAVSSTVQNDVVFFGKVIRPGSRLEGENKSPFLWRTESSSGRSNRVAGSVWSASTRENRWQRSDSRSGSRKHRSGLFGIVKFPLQMELSDMKMRQEKREPIRLPLPKPVAVTDDGSDGGGECCWNLVRPLRRRNPLVNALAKATFGCIPIV